MQHTCKAIEQQPEWLNLHYSSQPKYAGDNTWQFSKNKASRSRLRTHDINCFSTTMHILLRVSEILLCQALTRHACSQWLLHTHSAHTYGTNKRSVWKLPVCKGIRHGTSYWIGKEIELDFEKIVQPLISFNKIAPFFLVWKRRIVQRARLTIKYTVPVGLYDLITVC